jgi:hypothetical protein
VQPLLAREHGADVAEGKALVPDLGGQRAAQRLGAVGGEVSKRALRRRAAAVYHGPRLGVPAELWGAMEGGGRWPACGHVAGVLAGQL